MLCSNVDLYIALPCMEGQYRIKKTEVAVRLRRLRLIVRLVQVSWMAMMLPWLTLLLLHVAPCEFLHGDFFNRCGLQDGAVEDFDVLVAQQVMENKIAHGGL